VVLPAPLVVQLTNPEAGPVAVTVTASGPQVAVLGGGVVVPQGLTAAPLALTGVASTDGGVVTLTAASAVGPGRTATVRVLALDEPARLAGVQAARGTVPPGTSVELTVRLDLPAPAPATVTLALSPPAFGTLPATVTVPRDALTASATLFLAGGTGGQTGTVTATLGADAFQASVLAGTPAATHVVLSEVAVRGVTANDEFVELYNPTAQAVDLAGFTVQYLAASGNSGIKVVLPAGAAVEPRRHYLVSGPSYATAAVPPDYQDTRELNFSGTTGHVQLLDALGAVVDRLGYGTVGQTLPSLPEGLPFVGAAAPGPTESYERKANAGSTAATLAAGGLDELAGNGQDTDDNAADFVLRAVRNPQNGQAPAEP
jgi:hypothetical protein